MREALFALMSVWTLCESPVPSGGPPPSAVCPPVYCPIRPCICPDCPPEPKRLKPLGLPKAETMSRMPDTDETLTPDWN